MTVDYTQPPQQPGTPQRGWWSRNWKWVVPVGCVGIIAALAAFIGIIMAIVFGAIRSTDAYKGALRAAQNDPRVIAALGTPMKPGLFAGGNVNINGGTGHAEIDIPITGPKGKGTIYAEATKSAGDWTYSVLKVKVDGGPTIDLLSRE